MSNRPSICIFGAPLPSGNMGVQALAASLVTLLEHVCPGIEITILCGGQSGTRAEKVFVGKGFKTVTVCNYRMSLRAKWQEHLLIALFAAVLYRIFPATFVRRPLLSAFPILDKLVNAMFVGDIRGGDSFSDIYGVKGFVTGSLPCLVAFVLGKDLVLLPQTYGPFKARLARLVARWIIRRADLVLARDQASLTLVNQILESKGRSSHAQLCPDVAFCLDPSMPADPAIEPPLPDHADYHLIGFNVSGLLYNGGYSRNNMFGLRDNYQETAFQVLQFLLSLPDTRLLLIPHMYRFPEWNIESDIHASKELLSRLESTLQARVHIAAGNYDSHQVKALIGRCEFFVGSRMHSCIAALSQGIPTVGIAYSRKFKGVFEIAGVPETVLEATRLNREEIVRRISELQARADEIRAVLKKKLPEVTARTTRCFANRFSAPTNGKPNLPGEFPPPIFRLPQPAHVEGQNEAGAGRING